MLGLTFSSSVSIILFLSCHMLMDLTVCIDVSNLGFGGSGTRTTINNNYVYEFSSGFQDQVCTSCSDDTCWGLQGISKYGSYITRSMYQMGSSSDCDSTDTNDVSYAFYAGITVMRRTSQDYSHILLDFHDKSCHGGDHVIRLVDGSYYFFVACTSFVAIFSEDSIISSERVVNGKRFYYLVGYDDIMIRDYTGVSFSYISRDDGYVDQFFCGAYDSSTSSTSALNLKKIQMNIDDDFDISIITEYTVSSGVAYKVQGATQIGSYMYLVTSDYVRYCRISSGNDINYCYQKCTLSCGVLQGAETDSNGDLYVGTEFGGSCDMAFYEINSVSDESGDCISSSY